MGVNLSPFINADMILSCGWHAEITRTDKLYQNELNQKCQQTLTFYIQKLVNTDGSSECHEITFVDRVRFPTIKKRTRCKMIYSAGDLNG